MPRHGEGVGAVGGFAHLPRILKNDSYIHERLIGSTNFIIGRVYLFPIDVPVPCTIDMLGFQTGGAALGNVRIGLYPRGVIGYPDLPDGGALIVESAAFALLAASITQWFTIPNTALIQGPHFIAIQGDAVGGTYGRSNVTWDHNVLGAVNPARTYEQVFGPFTSPCPVTVGRPQLQIGQIRVVSVP